MPSRLRGGGPRNATAAETDAVDLQPGLPCLLLGGLCAYCSTAGEPWLLVGCLLSRYNWLECQCLSAHTAQATSSAILGACWFPAGHCHGGNGGPSSADLPQQAAPGPRPVLLVPRCGFCRRMYPRFSCDAPTLGRCCFQSGPGCCRFLRQRCAGGGSPLEAYWRVMALSEPRISHTSLGNPREALSIRVVG